jgi:hypothetical protein
MGENDDLLNRLSPPERLGEWIFDLLNRDVPIGGVLGPHVQGVATVCKRAEEGGGNRTRIISLEG